MPCAQDAQTLSRSSPIPPDASRSRDLSQQHSEERPQLHHLCGRQHDGRLVLFEWVELVVLGSARHDRPSPFLSRAGESLEAYQSRRAEIAKCRGKTVVPRATQPVLRRRYLRHPRWQASVRTVSLPNDDNLNAAKSESPHNAHGLAAARMERIVDQPLGLVLVGSMSLFRAAPSRPVARRPERGRRAESSSSSPRSRRRRRDARRLVQAARPSAPHARRRHQADPARPRGGLFLNVVSWAVVEAPHRTHGDGDPLLAAKPIADLLERQIGLVRDESEQPLLMCLEWRATMTGAGLGLHAACRLPSLKSTHRRRRCKVERARDLPPATAHESKRSTRQGQEMLISSGAPLG
jgi:hypothetical protein